MEQLIIFLLLALGSGISSYLQKKKKREAQESKGGQPPVPHGPATPRDWQEELRRILQGETVPPPLPPKIPPQPPKTVLVSPPPASRSTAPVAAAPRPEVSEGDLVFQSPLTEASNVHDRAAQLQSRVEKRFRAVDAQTTTHVKPIVRRKVVTPGSVVIKRWTANRESLREAFIASLIFAPPAGIQGPHRLG